MEFYKKNWAQINFKLPKNQQNIIRTSFFGGRCEVFGNAIPEEKILHFDFRGMYQQCMLESLPFDQFIPRFSNFNLSEPGFYHITAVVSHDYPVLPTRNSKLFFKGGFISGLFWHEEILLALEHKQLEHLTVNYAYISLKTEPILVEFIQTLDQLCTRGGIYKSLGKLLINSFYGRLGMSDDFFIITPDIKIHDQKSYHSLYDVHLNKHKVNTNPTANIAIASAITSKARIKLYQAFTEVWAHKGRILYCDTDSIFAAFKKDQPVENTNLGKHIHFNTTDPFTQVQDAVFISSKTYGIKLQNGEEYIRFKGITKPAITFQDLKSNFFSEKSSLLFKTTIFKKTNCENNISFQDKLVNLDTYNKRIWDETKHYTKPHINNNHYPYTI